MLEFFWCFSTGQHCSRQRVVCAETQRFCGLCRGSRGLENWKRFLIAQIGCGERAGESGRGYGGSCNMKGPVSPLKASLEESSLVVHWLRLHVSTTGITGSIPLLGELRFFSCRMAYPPHHKSIIEGNREDFLFCCTGSSLWPMGSLVVTCRLSCPAACGIFVP